MYENSIKEKAKELRTTGLSVNKIAKQLGIATSTISLWTKDVILTEDQKKNIFDHKVNGRTLAFSIFFENQRISSQKRGKERVNKENPLYLAGCMLYWGEGSKDLNSVRLTNSDPAMLLLFKKFLMACFDIKHEEFVLTLNCYTDLHSILEIEEYWLSVLDLNKSNLRKSQINNLPKSSKNSKVKKSEWGTACLMVHKTSVVQEIFGAIQEYASFSNVEWLNK